MSSTWHVRVLALVLAASVTAIAQIPVLHSIELIGGSNIDTLQQTAADTQGNVYVLGKTASPDFPTTRVYGVRATGSDSDLFVAKIRISDWSLVYSTLIGTAAPVALTLDKHGNAYLVGSTASQSFPATINAFRKNPGSNGSLFVAKLAYDDGSLVYATVLSATFPNAPSPIAVDDAGEAYIAARLPAAPSAGEAPIPPLGSLGGTQSDTYLLKLKADGSDLVFASTLPRSAAVYTIALDAAGGIYLGGGVDSYLTEFHASRGAFQTDFAGSGDAFVMKARPSGDSVEFATLLGGAGNDWASFLQVDTDGSIFLAGACEYGSPADPGKPFPTTERAPYRVFGGFRGFFAKLDPTASKLLFSTYLSESGSAYAGNPTSWAATPTGFHLARPDIVHNGFTGLNYSLTADTRGVRVLSLDRDGHLLRDPFFVPGLPAGGITANDTELILAGSSETPRATLPSSLSPIGPATNDPDRSVYVQSHIALVRCLFRADPPPVIETDRGYVRLRSPSPGGEPDWQLELTSPQDAVPFRLYPPPPTVCCSTPSPFDVTPVGGTTPARITIRGGLTEPAPLLIATPGGPASMQIVPIVSVTLPATVSGTLVAPMIAGPTGDPVEGDIALKATATDGSTFESFPGTAPFTVSGNSVPSWLTVTPMSGTAPATLHLHADVKDLAPGKSQIAVLNLIAPWNRLSIPVIVSRPTDIAAPAWGMPDTISLTMPRGGPSPTGRVAFQAPTGLAFQVTTSAPRLRVSPVSGAGPVTLELTLDPAAFDIGSFTETFQVQSDSVVATVQCLIRVTNAPPTPPPTIAPYFSYLRSPRAPSPGVRAVVSVLNVSLPDERWGDVSPAPQSWHGLSFRYGGATLPIVASFGGGTFAVQFPYDLKTGVPPLTLDLVSDSDGILASGTIFGMTLAASAGLVDRAEPVVSRADGTPVTADNPIRSGDHIFLSIVGAGRTDPAVALGELPPDGVVAIPEIPVAVYISGKSATVVRQALSPTRIGVTDLEIEVPLLYSGEHMLAIGNSSAYAVPLYVQN